MVKSNLPKHIGFIPDGNRRWAQVHNLPKEMGYEAGIAPGLALLRSCKALDIPEISIYGFTQDNTHRASIQKHAFSQACVKFALAAAQDGAALLVVGDDTSSQFPKELKLYRQRQGSGIKVNLLANYGWQWDLGGLRQQGQLQSQEVSRIDLIVRWGATRRLSGFLPAQSVYADIYMVEDYWPDYQPQHFNQALRWFHQQDRTLGG